MRSCRREKPLIHEVHDQNTKDTRQEKVLSGRL